MLPLALSYDHRLIDGADGVRFLRWVVEVLAATLSARPGGLNTHANPQATQLAIVGGGPGGYAAAFLAADLGMQVTLIDQEPNPGGVCLYRGCIPSKALLHVAKVLEDARQATHWGVTFAEPTIDVGKLRTWKEGVVRKLTGGLGDLCKRRGVTFVQGRATFVDATTLSVQTTQGRNNASRSRMPLWPLDRAQAPSPT